MQEDRSAESAYFITLTYNNESIRLSDNGFGTLRKRDVQLFIKRVRTDHFRNDRKLRIKNRKPIKYYCAGEYGSETKRPHYHIIIFNSEIKYMISKEDYTVLQYCGMHGDIPVICNQWYCEETGEVLGHITIGKLTEASVGYTLKYLCKPRWRPKHDRDDRQKQFALMSKGLGISYLTEENCSWHLQNLEQRMYVNIPGGKKAAMPRYYKDRLYYPDERDVLRQVMEILADEQDSRNYKRTDLQCHNWEQYREHSKVLMNIQSSKNTII